MPDRLLGIIVCLLLAVVVDYTLNEALEGLFSHDAPFGTVDQSTLTNSRLIGSQNTSSQPTVLRSFYAYLAGGGTNAYLQWRSDTQRSKAGPAYARALRVANQTDTVRLLSLALLIATVLIMVSGLLDPRRFLSTILSPVIIVLTVALYGGLAAPLWTLTVAFGLVLYLTSLKLFLPLYRLELSALIRPFLTSAIFLLAVMAWRGHELVDYWFWTSHLFRLSLAFVLLLSVYFHLARLDYALKNAGIPSYARVFGYGLPLGVALIGVGLLLGSYGEAAGAGLGVINRELLLVPDSFMSAVNPEAPFTLFFAGVTLLIIGGVGYYVQRIAE